MKRCPKCTKHYQGDNVSFCPDDGEKLDDYVPATKEERLIGLVLDKKYRIDKKVADGGMSTIYLATHMQLEIPVAVKVMHERLIADDNAIKRFRREAQSAMQIRHTNAITVMDFGVTENNLVYLIMEYLQGQTLGERLKVQRLLPIQEINNIFQQVCAAVKIAHRRNIVHRDLKPDNIFIHIDGDTEVIKVLDFGIAKLDILSVTSDRLTQIGNVLGSPQYMSPEQFGEGTIGVRSDVYALGVILYELLTGELPFKAPDLATLAYKHMTEKPRSLLDIRPELPASLDAFVLRVMSKIPEARPDDAGVFAEELQDVINSSISAGAGGTKMLVSASPKEERLSTEGASLLSLYARPEWSFIDVPPVLESMEGYEYISAIFQPDFFGMMAEGHMNGTTWFSNGVITKGLVWQDGQLIFGISNDQGEKFGERLVRQGRLSRTQLNDAIRNQYDLGERSNITDCFISLNILPETAILSLLSAHIYSVAYSLLDWEECGYVFDPHVYQPPVKVSLSVSELILEAARGLIDFGRIKAALNDDGGYWQASPVWLAKDSTVLRPDEQRILATLSSPHTIEQLVSVLELPVEQITRVLCAFTTLRAIERPMPVSAEPVVADVWFDAREQRNIETKEDLSYAAELNSIDSSSINSLLNKPVINHDPVNSPLSAENSHLSNSGSVSGELSLSLDLPVDLPLVPNNAPVSAAPLANTTPVSSVDLALESSFTPPISRSGSGSLLPQEDNEPFTLDLENFVASDVGNSAAESKPVAPVNDLPVSFGELFGGLANKSSEAPPIRPVDANVKPIDLPLFATTPPQPLVPNTPSVPPVVPVANTPSVATPVTATPFKAIPIKAISSAISDATPLDSSVTEAKDQPVEPVVSAETKTSPSTVVPTASAAPAKPIDYESMQMFWYEVENTLSGMVRNDDYYAMLGVAVHATDDEIRAIYESLIKRFDPKNHQELIGQLPSLADQLNNIIQKATEAYKTLSNHGKRAKYNEKIKRDKGRFIELSPAMLKMGDDAPAKKDLRNSSTGNRSALESPAQPPTSRPAASRPPTNAYPVIPPSSLPPGLPPGTAPTTGNLPPLGNVPTPNKPTGSKPLVNMFPTTPISNQPIARPFVAAKPTPSIPAAPEKPATPPAPEKPTTPAANTDKTGTPKVTSGTVKVPASPPTILSQPLATPSMMGFGDSSRLRNPDDWYLFGLELLERGDGERAVRAFLNAVKLRPKDAEFHAALARAYAVIYGYNLQTLEEYENAISLKPNSADYPAEVALFYIKHNYLEEAEQYVETSLKLDAKNRAGLRAKQQLEQKKPSK